MEALLKFYIGKSLRQDLAKLFKGADSRHNGSSTGKAH